MMASLEVFSKYERLKHDLRPFTRVAVAFSGGVDSSLLLYASIESLGVDNVLALHGRSCLNETQPGIEVFHSDNYPEHKHLIMFDLDPLSCPDFIKNCDKRCYYCKKKTYSVFQEYLLQRNVTMLLDGTNVDDLSQIRPGYTALKELGVETPLVRAGLTKKENRFLAQSFGLSCYNTPSNSCLATRLPTKTKMSKDNLKIVENIEFRLKKMGFSGCRVRPQGSQIIVEVSQKDFTSLSHRHNRLILIEECGRHGYKKVMLDLAGRP